MLIALILLSVAFIILVAYLLYYKRQIKDVGDQLAFISSNDSFKFIYTQIKPKELSRLIDLCNTMLRNQRELNQEFIYKSEEINTTIVNLSHDIRTPITSLAGYLQLAKRAEHLEEKTAYVELAEGRIKQINTLVDELFLYTKLQNPEYELEMESIAITNVLKKSLFSFMDDFSQKETEPQLALSESEQIIDVNENALERVFENIINNYFVHGKGALHIEEETKESQLLIHFSNLMKHEEQLDFDKIFTRFYKEDTSRTNHSTGLGLSIVKSLMEKMHGTVEADMIDQHFHISLIFNKEGYHGGGEADI